MSLVNLIVQEDAAYLMTDSGSFSQDGTIFEFVRKEIVVPSLPVAITATGLVSSVFPAVRSVLDHLLPPEEFTLDEFLTLVRNAYTALELDPEVFASTWIAAYYSRQHGRAFGFKFFTNEGGGRPGSAPWTWIPTGLSLMPAINPSELFGGGGDIAIGRRDRFDVAARSMSILEAQRRCRVGDRGLCAVAGQVLLTKVSASGVQQLVLHEYSDRLGAFAAADLVPA